MFILFLLSIFNVFSILFSFNFFFEITRKISGLSTSLNKHE